MIRIILRELRLKHGYTQAYVAEKIEVNQTAVSNWEKGKGEPLPKYQRKLAALFNVTVDELMKKTK